jgi:hypothetical protein
MDHCIESGYALVGESGEVSVLDAKATPQVLSAVKESQRERGIRLRATREQKGEEMETVAIEELESPLP